MVHLTCGYLNLADLDPTASIQAAAAGGFSAIGLRITGHRPGDAGPDVVGNRRATDELRKVLDDSGIALANISTYRFVPETNPGDYKAVLDAAAALGAGVMVANCFTPDEGLATDNLAAVCELAGRFGIRVGLEFIPVSNVPTLERAAAIMSATRSPAAGLVIDALHLARSGGSPADVAAVDPALILAVQLCDAPLAAPPDLYAEMRAGRLYPGEGELPLAALLEAVPSAGVEIEVEVPHLRVQGLSGVERARRAHKATTTFLASLGR